MVKGDISFYMDTLIVQALLDDEPLSKNAQNSALSGLEGMVKNYFSAHFDPNNKTNSVLDMLAPGLLFSMFSSIGQGRLGLIFGFLASALHIDIAGMIGGILNAIKGTLERGGQVTPAQLDSAVNETVQQHAAGGTANPTDQSHAWDKRNFNQQLKDARLIRLAAEQYEMELFQLRKDSAPSRGWQLFSTPRGKTTSIAGSVIGWVFKLILISAGFMVAGDVANKMLGRPNALDRNYQYQAGQTTTTTAPVSPTTSQSKFPLNPSYQDEPAPRPWEIGVTNDESSITNMLVGFTKDVYSGLDGKEGAIMSSPTFQAVRDQIAWYNHTAEGEPQIYIPSMYTSKKSIVDHYIDEVAKNAQ